MAKEHDGDFINEEFNRNSKVYGEKSIGHNLEVRVKSIIICGAKLLNASHVFFCIIFVLAYTVRIPSKRFVKILVTCIKVSLLFKVLLNMLQLPILYT